MCELIDTDKEKLGKLEIVVEDAEMSVTDSTPEFVFQKRPKPEQSEQQQPQDYKVFTKEKIIASLFRWKRD